MKGEALKTVPSILPCYSIAFSAKPTPAELAPAWGSNRNPLPFVIPAEAGIQAYFYKDLSYYSIPASAGMTI